MQSQPETLLEFPCRFPLKIMGVRHDEFSQTIFEVVRVHAPDVQASDVEMRMSSGGKYLSVTVTITATSKAQLDDLYRALTAHPMVKVVL
ncbi:HP0495 family protein [Parachitinimonas caeni]|uniref:UPF0250 protein PZA18_01920 n=1 Tax=Parachitinimonas caeni TaxID=3031301 RepID=A0ABT7DRX1_9NEIS|nr:DUF493 domain-containing protein [Parachitinimonas caeni]MDK2122801.1 DUF493 domain-containing protein [Parachitinimonas caeni]